MTRGLKARLFPGCCWLCNAGSVPQSTSLADWLHCVSLVRLACRTASLLHWTAACVVLLTLQVLNEEWFKGDYRDPAAMLGDLPQVTACSFKLPAGDCVRQL